MSNEPRRFRIRNLSLLRAKSKTLLIILVSVVVSFSIGVYANKVIVQNVQSLSGNHVIVPAPELEILNSVWQVDLNTSTVVGVALTLTTTGGTNIPFKLYQVYVQVSCSTDQGVTVFTCSTGTNTIVLPTNMNATGASAILLVSLSPPVHEETLEVDDLSFIVSGTTVTTPTISVVASPSALTKISGDPAFVEYTIFSVDQFSGVVNAEPTPVPWLVERLSTPSISLTADGTATVSANITATGAAGFYFQTVDFQSATNPQVIESGTIELNVPSCIPDFTITASPTILSLTTAFPSATVALTLISVCGFQGSVTLSVSNGPLIVSISSPSVFLAAKMSVVVVGEVVGLSATALPPPGAIVVTTTATSLGPVHTVSVAVSVP